MTLEKVLKHYIHMQRTPENIAKVWVICMQHQYPECGFPEGYELPKQDANKLYSYFHDCNTDYDLSDYIRCIIIDWDDFCMHCQECHGGWGLPLIPTINFLSFYTDALHSYLYKITNKD